MQYQNVKIELNWNSSLQKISGLSAQYNYRSGGNYGTNRAADIYDLYSEYGGDYGEDQRDYGINRPGTDYGNNWAGSRDLSLFSGRHLLSPFVEKR